MLSLKSLSIAFLFLIACAISLAFLPQEKHWGSGMHPWFKVAPKQDKEVFETVLEHRRKGDFDGAITIALKGSQGRPPDDFLYQTVADTYFEWAQKDPARRVQLVDLALKYSERALANNPADIVNIFNVGESYLSAGMNLSGSSSCSYYKKSSTVFEKLRTQPVLNEDWGTIEGETVPMEPYRQALEQKIQQVRMALARCPAFAEKQ